MADFGAQAGVWAEPETVTLPIRPTPIPSAEALGTPVIPLRALPVGIPSGEALGSPGAFRALGVAPAGSPSAEAFGAARLRRPLTAPSAQGGEAVGTARLLSQLAPAPVTSAEAFGAAVTVGGLSPRGVAPAETFGGAAATPGAVPLAPRGAASGESFGQTTAAQVIASGIASGEAFGLAAINEVLRAAPAQDGEVFGTPTLTGARFVPAGVATAEAFGGATLTSLLIAATSAQAGAQFGAPVVAGPITARAIAAGEAVGRPVAFLPSALSVTPSRGLFRGGTALRFFGGQLRLDACGLDTSLTGWTATGTVTTTSGRVTLTAGPTLGAAARLTHSASVLDADVEVEFLSTAQLPRDGDEVVLAEVALGPQGRFRLQVRGSRDYGARAFVLGRSDEALFVGPPGPLRAGYSSTLRLLRAGAEVYAWANGSLLMVGASDGAHIEVAASNGATGGGLVQTEVTAYTRRPVVRLGAPVLDLKTTGPLVARGTSGPVPCDTGTVDLLVSGCEGSPSVRPAAFTFEREEDLIRLRARDTGLIVCNDPRLRRR